MAALDVLIYIAKRKKQGIEKNMLVYAYIFINRQCEDLGESYKQCIPPLLTEDTATKMKELCSAEGKKTRENPEYQDKRFRKPAHSRAGFSTMELLTFATR